MLYIDVTDTFLKWKGAPTGIQRTLACLAEAAKNDKTVALCARDTNGSLWRVVPEDIFLSIFNQGHSWEIISPGKALSLLIRHPRLFLPNFIVLLYNGDKQKKFPKGVYSKYRMKVSNHTKRAKILQNILKSRLNSSLKAIIITVYYVLPCLLTLYLNNAGHPRRLIRAFLLETMEKVTWRPWDALVTLDTCWNQKRYFKEISQFKVRPQVIGFVYDLIPLLTKFDSPAMVQRFREWILEISQYAEKIVCISKYTSRCIQKFLDSIDPTILQRIDISVVRSGNALPASFKKNTNSITLNEILSSAGINTGELPKKIKCAKEWFFWLGSVNARKNPDVLLRALEEIANDREKSLPPVVIAGKFSEEYRRYLKYSEKSRIAACKVIFIDSPSDETVNQLYNGASLFIFTSHYEGYGLPVAEALQKGIPVIASNATSIPEVGGNLVEYFKPDDYQGLANLLRKFNSDASFRNELIKRAQSFKPTPWSTMLADIKELSVRRPVKNLFENPDPKIYTMAAPSDWNGLCFPPAEPCCSKTRLTSAFCTMKQLDSPAFRYWAEKYGKWYPHRKVWELSFICQALYERGLLKNGSRGLVFAVGQEPLPALFASMGCEITATDISIEDNRSEIWVRSNQHCSGLSTLARPDIIPSEKFYQKVSFRPVDMNNIPADLMDYDFVWSTCSFEHSGSIESGMHFLEKQMQCLKPGGTAVHTTEFNLSSQEETVEKGTTVIYRRKDIEKIIKRLHYAGHIVEPICSYLGEEPEDNYIAYTSLPTSSSSPHLKLFLYNKYISTSIALIITKGWEKPSKPQSGEKTYLKT